MNGFTACYFDIIVWKFDVAYFAYMDFFIYVSYTIFIIMIKIIFQLCFVNSTLL